MVKKLLLLLLAINLVACNKVESETKEIVRNSLKDPTSAKFQNLKKYCGEVNAKNSYGGYTGFKKFYISNSEPVFMPNDDEGDNLQFELGWLAHCEIDSKLTNNKKTSCASYANFSASVVKNKLSGGLAEDVINIVKDNTDANIYIDTINEVFSSKKIINPKQYALSTLKDCLSGKKTVPY